MTQPSITRYLLPLLLCGTLLGSVPAEAARRRKKGDWVETSVRAAEEALVQAPQDQDVCFTPGEPCEMKLLRFIQSAKKSIDVAIYDINLERVVESLIQTSRKLEVRVVIDRKQAKTRESLAKELIRSGVHVRLGHQRGIMHNKFMIVDRKMVETGSFNYTHGAAKDRNNENQVYLASPNMVERFQKRFDKLWESADPAP
jgi:phosphatidylserine/phosphatidylglycerophosphate/cardiolipin synthase-like enzyme